MARREAARRHGWLVIPATFAAAFVLAAIPLPPWAAPFRPDWVGLVLIYWCIATPQRVGVGSGWTAGLLLDLLYGSLLGHNALAKTVVAYLALTFRFRIRMFPVWQQAGAVLALLMVDQALGAWVKGMLGRYDGSWTYWMPAVSGMVIWPWLFVVLRDLRRFARLSESRPIGR